MDQTLQHFYEFVLQQETDNFTPKPSHKQQASEQELAGFKKGIKREMASYPTMNFVLQQQTDNFTPKPSHKQQASEQQLPGFKKGIKREMASYPTLKDERHSNFLSRSLYITGKSHECDEVLEPDYALSTEDKEQC